MADRQHYDTYVPDDGPENSPILLVGEAPGETEMEQGKPFVGASGDILIQVLARHGVVREHVRLANLCHYRPFGNKFESLLQTEALKSGLVELYRYIERTRPVVIGALGGWPLTFLTGKKGIKRWRGSILTYIHDETIKVIPTNHPAAVTRDRGLYPTFSLDIKRIIGDSTFRDRRLPQRQFVADPRGLELEEWTQRLCQSDALATDIENVKKSTHILCIGFAPSPEVGVCIDPNHPEGKRACERILASPTKKIFQFGQHDVPQLKMNGYTIGGEGREHGGPYHWDTMIAQHAIAPELPRSLEYMTSIYTREPYYKQVGRGSIPDDNKSWSATVDRQPLFEYNIRDTTCTSKVYEAQKPQIENDADLLHVFNFEMDSLNDAIHISEAGLPIDKERRALIEAALLVKWAKKQYALNAIVGCEANVRSPKMKTILYDKRFLGLPTRRKHDGTITADEDAIVSLIAYCKDRMDSVIRDSTKLDWRLKLEACKLILEIRGIRQVLSVYVVDRPKSPRLSIDGRIHSTFKVPATETGRWSASKYVDGTGFNAQTLPRDPWDIPDDFIEEFKEKQEAKLRLMAELEDDDADEPEETEEAA